VPAAASVSRSAFVAAINAHVHGAAWPFSPDAPQLAFLDHAQQPELHRRRHLADLVQEDRAAVRLLEQPVFAPPSRR